MVTGYEWRETRRREQEAVWVSCLMNATGNFKEPVTPQKLLGGGKSKKDDPDTVSARLRQRALAKRAAARADAAKRRQPRS